MSKGERMIRVMIELLTCHFKGVLPDERRSAAEVLGATVTPAADDALEASEFTNSGQGTSSDYLAAKSLIITTLLEKHV